MSYSYVKLVNYHGGHACEECEQNEMIGKNYSRSKVFIAIIFCVVNHHVNAMNPAALILNKQCIVGNSTIFLIIYFIIYYYIFESTSHIKLVLPCSKVYTPLTNSSFLKHILLTVTPSVKNFRLETTGKLLKRQAVIK